MFAFIFITLIVVGIFALAIPAQAEHPANAWRAPKVPGATQAQRVRAAELSLAKHVDTLRFNDTRRVLLAAEDAFDAARVAQVIAEAEWIIAGQPLDGPAYDNWARANWTLVDARNALDVAEDDHHYCSERCANINAIVG